MCVCVCLSGNRTLVSPLHTNESFSFHLMLFFCSIKSEWRMTTLITRPFKNPQATKAGITYSFSLWLRRDTGLNKDNLPGFLLCCTQTIKSLTVPWRQDHFSKWPVTENSGFTEHIAAVGVNDVNPNNVCFLGILKNILIFTESLKNIKRYFLSSFHVFLITVFAPLYPSLL